MYIPKQFQNTDVASIKAFIRANGFGILVSQSDGQIAATHIPLEFSADETRLLGHVSKANPQWKKFESNPDVLIIFNGPHAYISPTWYDHENVPTWNYVAVHVQGKAALIEGEALLESLKDLVNHYESGSKCPVKVENMSPEYLKREMNGLVGFEVTITSIEAAHKLSQNRDQKNFRNVIQELEKRGDYESVNVAGEMRKHEKASGMNR